MHTTLVVVHIVEVILYLWLFGGFHALWKMRRNMEGLNERTPREMFHIVITRALVIIFVLLDFKIISLGFSDWVRLLCNVFIFCAYAVEYDLMGPRPRGPIL